MLPDGSGPADSTAAPPNISAIAIRLCEILLVISRDSFADVKEAGKKVPGK